MRMGGQRHAPAALPPGKRPGTHYTGDWVGTQGRSGRVRKIFSPIGIRPRTVQPVASPYTDWAIQFHVLDGRNIICNLALSCLNLQKNKTFIWQ
jgi:hypothetical protein